MCVTGKVVDVSGEVWDIYDWAFWGQQVPAALQVCYEPQCGRTEAGKVFGHRTLLSRDGINPEVTITIQEQ